MKCGVIQLRIVINRILLVSSHLILAFQVAGALNLETAVGREKDVQDIDVHGGFAKRVVTLLVMSAFSNFPGAARACADFRDPTAVSRLNICVIIDQPHYSLCAARLHFTTVAP
jgi:hypothetical protein